MRIQAASDKQQATKGEQFQVVHRDATTKARRGQLRTAHGVIETPCFMPCATQGTVKALSAWDLTQMGARIILSNVYHLYLRPGKETLSSLGGLHRFMNWQGAILTDSGGFQVFSLAERRKVTEEGVTFQSHLDGAAVFLSPEEVIRFQGILGSDILMPLDECVEYPVEKGWAREAMERTVRWAQRSKETFDEQQATSDKQQLFGIVQGSIYSDLRKECCERLVEVGFDGYAVGGLSVGEPKALQWEMVEACVNALQATSDKRQATEKCLYLMGVGTPPDILEAVTMGVDLFDCVLPTRNARNGQAFTKYGTLNLKNARFAREEGPLEEGCCCRACQTHSRAYVHHLIKAKEILGLSLMTSHNLHFYFQLMSQIRETVSTDRFSTFKKEFLSAYPAKEGTHETP